MILLNGSNIKKMFLDETLFDSVSFNVDSNDKIGFIGVNGAGKSTFLKILSGELDSTTGEVSIDPNCRMSVLKQDHFAYDEYTVLGYDYYG